MKICCNGSNSVIVDLDGRALPVDFADSYGYVSALLRPFAGACRLAGCALGYVRIKERFFTQL